MKAANIFMKTSKVISKFGENVASVLFPQLGRDATRNIKKNHYVFENKVPGRKECERV